MNRGSTNKNQLIIIGAAIIVALLLGYGLYYYRALSESLTERVGELEQSLKETQSKLALAEEENSNLAEAFRNEQNKVQLFEGQVKGLLETVEQLTGTVGVLDKLSKTDPELLKKYSKVYFLNENYTPQLLTIIDSKYIYDKNRPQQIHVDVAPFLKKMLKAAEAGGIELRVVSAYRSFGTQAAVKSGYKVTYGAGTANQFSADQGYSEHQLGSTVDFTSTETEDVFYKFEDTKAYKWLTDNAYKYGFILSYPPENDYYQFEPWHWRFVGVKLATKLYNEGKYFYEMPQREIDEYLVNIFD